MDVEKIGHGSRVIGVQVDVLGTEDVLDGAEHVRLAVAGAYDRVLLHIGANEVGRRAMRIDVVGSILRVIFDDDDQDVLGVAAVSVWQCQTYRPVYCAYQKLRLVTLIFFGYR